ncbi:hypothetical protein CXB51_025825 [Gossypium anomalum]|uniref:DUF3700 domain-containing protein n=1 Tax=Gossypium anomalum TaxID=47600 RepID=A0A8J5YRG8_9ROSI|nr:hypothetical protein CXB51_025825 [Gossypium anomalum]
MLAVFDKSVAKSPDALNAPDNPQAVSALKNASYLITLPLVYPGSVSISLGSGVMAYSLEKQNPLLQQMRGIIVIEAYRTLRDRGPTLRIRLMLMDVYLSSGELMLKTTCFADAVETVKKGCVGSLCSIPKSSGEVCGATFSVDVEAKKESTGMKKVGSAANWSSNY